MSRKSPSTVDSQVPDYEYGSCHILAIALSRLAKIPIHASIKWDDDCQRTVLVHCWASLGGTRALSFAGEEEVSDMLERYPESSEKEAEMVCLTEADLLGILGLKVKKLESDIARAADTANELIARHCHVEVQETGLARDICR